MNQMSKREWGLVVFVGVMCLIAVLGPQVTQFDSYHDFADKSNVLGLPHAWDVLSNVPFALIGVGGLWVMRRFSEVEGSIVARDMLLLFFYGLIVTSVCSSFYHLSPDNASVFLDRLGMTVAFAGILALAVTVCVSDRAGKMISYLVLFLGPVCLWVWQQTDNLLAWSVLQAGGMLVIVGLAAFTKASKSLRVALAYAIGWYFLSKLCELGDHAIYEWTFGLMPGHSLKHIVAAFAGIPLINYLRRIR